MSPGDRISVRQRLEVDKDNPEVDEEVFSPGFGLDGTVGLGTGGPAQKTRGDLNEHTRTGGPVQARTGGPADDRTGGPSQKKKRGLDTERTGGPVLGGGRYSPVYTSEDTGAEPKSQVETVLRRRTSIKSKSQVETEPQIEIDQERSDPRGSIGFGANNADGLGDLNGGVVDLGPADRLGSSPWPGDTVSAVYPSPPTDTPLVSKSARAPPQTDTHNLHGQVATIKVAEGQCHPSREHAEWPSTEKTPNAVQVSQYLDICWL